MEEVKKVAKYLASEISKSDYFDINSLESKIYAALVVIAPPESKRSKEIGKLQSKIGEIKSNKAFALRKKDEELKFWKSKARKMMDDWQIQESYNELDEILIANGYEVKR